jgi:hypothetical protein
MNETLLKIKNKLWGEKLLAGLPKTFKKFAMIITNMPDQGEPPYEKLIDLMLTHNTKDGPSKFTGDDIFKISWNEFINKSTGDFHNE